MSQKLTKTDARRVATFEKFVRDINTELKGKSATEINNLFDIQDELLDWISVDNLKESLLSDSKRLRYMALNMTKNFDFIIHNLENCEKLLVWKNLDEINLFFDKTLADTVSIPDQRMRQTLMNQIEYWRKRRVDNFLVTSLNKLFDDVTKDRKITWTTKDEIIHFFDKIYSDISKISDKNLATSMLAYANILKTDALHFNDSDFKPNPFLESLSQAKPKK